MVQGCLQGAMVGDCAGHWALGAGCRRSMIQVGNDQDRRSA
jgi:hypothetical protein